MNSDEFNGSATASPETDTPRSVSGGLGHIGVESKISASLRAEEEARGIRILYAAESGSRAWGFASPDFPNHFAASDLDSATREAIDAVLAAKRDASECDRIALPPVLASLFKENEKCIPAAEFPTREHADAAELDSILRKSLS